MKMNVVIVYNQLENQILMCLRAKNPYLGKYNLVGGKLEEGETGLEGAYRELWEETGISRKEIELTHLMDFHYHLDDIEIQVYVGKLTEEVELIEEINPLYWVDINENFFDMNKYAGEGNIGHMVEQVKYHQNQLFKKEKDMK